MKKERCLGVGITSLSCDEIISNLEQRLESDVKTAIVAVNPEKIMMAQKNENLAAFIEDATYAVPDGIGIVIASKINKGQISSRITGIQMMQMLLHYANEKKKRIFLYGGKEEVVKRVVAVLQKQFPQLDIAGYEHGYVKDTQKVISKINESGAEFLFIALGSPRQELWIQQHGNSLQVKVMQGVGGSFDVIAGEVRRAPILFQKLGMEWLYRLVREPKRFKRQSIIPIFLWKTVRNMTKSHSSSLIEGDKN